MPERSCRPSFAKRVASRVTDLLAVSVATLLGLVGWRTTLRLGSLLGRVAYRICPRKGARGRRNLSQAGVQDCAKVVKSAWQSVSQTTLEILWLTSRRPDQVMDRLKIVGLDVLRAAAGEGRGVLLVSGHLANWEYMSLAAAKAGIPLAVVAETMRTRRLERLMVRFRQRCGVRTLMRGGPGTSFVAARWLFRGGLLGCMIDRTRFGSRITVPFLGQATRMPLGPARLACRTGSAVVLACAQRLADGTTQVVFKRLPTDGLDDPSELTRRIGLALEHEVGLRPEQWLWIFRRQPSVEGIRAAESPEFETPIVSEGFLVARHSK